MSQYNFTRVPHVSIDLTGNTIGEWQVLSEAPRDPVYPNRRRWYCKCSCGQIKVVQQHSLLRGDSKSCGHLYRERLGNLTRKHGLRSSPIYMRWWAMMNRCYDSNVKSYRHYGGRGIKVCEHWHHFPNFFADMGFPPSKEHSLDRINVDGDYEPSNCRWATKKEQSRNTRRNHYLSAQGETLCLSEWAERLGVKPTQIRKRLKRGWSVEEALGFKER